MYIPVIEFLITLWLIPGLAISQPFLSNDSLGLAIVLTVAVAIVLYALSICLSIRIMKKKKCEVNAMDFTVLVVVLLLGIGIPLRNNWIRKYKNKDDDISSRR